MQIYLLLNLLNFVKNMIPYFNICATDTPLDPKLKSLYAKLYNKKILIIYPNNFTFTMLNLCKVKRLKNLSKIKTNKKAIKDFL